MNIFNQTESIIRFFGETDTITFTITDHFWQTYEADISEVGAIQAIQLYSHFAIFDDVILTVMPVPEPTTWMLFVLGVAVVFSIKGRRDRKDLFRAFRMFRG